MWRFAAFKISPFVQTGRALYTGKTGVGDKIEPSMALAKSIVPLILEDVAEAAKSGGLKRATMTASLAFVGVGVNTYGTSYERVLQIDSRYNRLKKDDKKAAREFRTKNRTLLSMTESAKRTRTDIKALEKKRDEAKEKGRDSRVKFLDKRIDKKIMRFEERFNRRVSR